MPGKGGDNTDHKLNSDPHLDYEIYSFDKDGTFRIEKYGITGREDNKDGNNGRPAYQDNKLNKLDPIRAYSWKESLELTAGKVLKQFKRFWLQNIIQYHKSRLNNYYHYLNK